MPPLMRRIARRMAKPLALLALLGSCVAQAQFANKSLGLSTGYLKLNADPTLDWGVPLTLESSLYIESSFELVGRFDLMVMTERLNGTQVVAIGPHLGVRYLLSEESVRPYLGLDLAFIHVWGRGLLEFAGPSPNAGLDYFVTDSVSVGGRGFFTFFIALNEPLRTAYGALFVVATYF